MKKRTYQQPKMEVVKLEQEDIICKSQFTPKQSPQNESYEEEEEYVTRGWFN